MLFILLAHHVYIVSRYIVRIIETQQHDSVSELMLLLKEGSEGKDQPSALMQAINTTMSWAVAQGPKRNEI